MTNIGLQHCNYQLIYFQPKVARIAIAIANRTAKDVIVAHVEVRELREDSYARSIGIECGDHIVSFNGEPVTSVGFLNERIIQSQGRNMSLYILRQGRKVIVYAMARPLGAELSPSAMSMRRAAPARIPWFLHGLAALALLSLLLLLVLSLATQPG